MYIKKWGKYNGSFTVKLSKKEQELFSEINNLSEGKQNQLYAYIDGLTEEGTTSG